jgi:hypothetical protein
MIRSSVWLRLALAFACVFFVDGSRAEAPTRRVVVDGSEAPLRSFDSAGRPVAETQPDAGAAAMRTPISLPEFQPTPPASLEISGPSSVAEGSSVGRRAKD